MARQQQVRKARKLQAAVKGLEVDGADPELAAQVLDERVAVARCQRPLEGLRRQYSAICSPPTACGIEGRTVWVDPAVSTILYNSGAAWWAPKSLRVVDLRELVVVPVATEVAQPGGRNQVMAFLVGLIGGHTGILSRTAWFCP